MAHRVVALERQRERRSGRHEPNQRAEKGPLAMHFVERFGARPGQEHHLGIANLKTFGFQVGDDLPRVSGGDGVWFDNCQGKHGILYRRSLSNGTTSAGRCITLIPAFASAVIFSAAVPDEPEMIAPAWPIPRPGGAVWPGGNPTTGFLVGAFPNSAARRPSVPPTSPVLHSGDGFERG